jgi:hypothetical protein
MHSDPEIEEILAEQRRQLNRDRLRRLGILALVILAIVVLAFVSEPYLRSVRNQGNEASAIGSLRAIFSAQIDFSSTTCSGYYATRLTQLGRPDAFGHVPLNADLTIADRVEKSGYHIWIDAAAAADAPPCHGLRAGQVARSFVIRAEPLPGQGEAFFALSSESPGVYQDDEPVRFANGVATGGAIRR